MPARERSSPSQGQYRCDAWLPSEVPIDRVVIPAGAETAQSSIAHVPWRVGDVADVVHVETQQRAHLRFLERFFDASQPFGAQALKIHPLFPVNPHRAKCFKRHVHLRMDTGKLVDWLTGKLVESADMGTT
jgi:hypothetical protein